MRPHKARNQTKDSTNEWKEVGSQVTILKSTIMAAICPKPMVNGHAQTIASDIEEPHPAGELLFFSSPGALEQTIDDFIENYNYFRCHEGIGNAAPADSFFGRAPAILVERSRIKEQNIQSVVCSKRAGRHCLYQPERDPSHRHGIR